MHYAQLQLQNLLERCETVITSSYNCCCLFARSIRLRSVVEEEEKEKEGLLLVRGLNIPKADSCSAASPATQSWQEIQSGVSRHLRLRLSSTGLVVLILPDLSPLQFVSSFSLSCICCCLVLISCFMFHQIMIRYNCLFCTFQKHADACNCNSFIQPREFIYHK